MWRASGTVSRSAWATNFSKNFALKIIRLYENKNYEKTHLDICCGVGCLCDILEKNGFICHGVDIDKYAIFEAKKKNKKVSFHNKDFFKFNIKKRFQSASASHDIVNTICKSKSELLLFFKKVNSFLVDGGIFIFDLITPKGFQYDWNDFQAYEHPDFYLCQKCTYNDSTKNAFIDLVGFLKEKKSTTYQKFSVRESLRCYEITEVKKAIKKSGFKELETFSIFSAFHNKEKIIESNENKLFFVCTK